VEPRIGGLTPQLSRRGRLLRRLPLKAVKVGPVGCSVLFGMADLTLDDRRTYPR